MKQAVYGIVIGMIIILTIGIILTINGKKTRQGEIDNSLSMSVENAVKTTMREKTYRISDEEAFIADFTQNLLLQISNDSALEVQVAKADYERGLLSVKVVEHFTHPNGKEGKNECETTVVFEQVPNAQKFVTITYLMDLDTLYKEYQIVKGEPVIVPKNPIVEGKTFVGWQKSTDEGVKDIDGNAESDTTYLAVFE